MPRHARDAHGGQPGLSRTRVMSAWTFLKRRWLAPLARTPPVPRWWRSGPSAPARGTSTGSSGRGTRRANPWSVSRPRAPVAPGALASWCRQGRAAGWSRPPCGPTRPATGGTPPAGTRCTGPASGARVLSPPSTFPGSQMTPVALAPVPVQQPGASSRPPHAASTPCAAGRLCAIWARPMGLRPTAAGARRSAVRRRRRSACARQTCGPSPTTRHASGGWNRPGTRSSPPGGWPRGSRGPPGAAGRAGPRCRHPRGRTGRSAPC
jgi:hypothetical protein